MTLGFENVSFENIVSAAVTPSAQFTDHGNLQLDR